MSGCFKDIVTDWGGFEEFIKEIHKDNDIKVERDVKLTGKSAATRQIDVLLTHQKGPYIYKTLIECKHWKNKVKRQQVENLAASLEDLNASKGIIFTTIGFQSGAELYAKSKGISIYIVRDLKPNEWGLPGKNVEFYIQIYTKSIIDIQPYNSFMSNPLGEKRTGNGISLKFGENKTRLQEFSTINSENNNLRKIELLENQITSTHKNKGETLEKYLEGAADYAMKEFQKKDFLINGGDDCIRYFQMYVDMPFEEKGELLKFISYGRFIQVSKFKLSVGIRVNQFMYRFDRSSPYFYSLAVEDCISSNVFAITKRDDDDITNWTKLSPSSSESNDVLKNGSIMKVTTSGFFDNNEIKGLNPVELEEKKST